MPAADVRHLDVDCIVYQSHHNWLVDQHEILSDEQRRLPRVFLEHDPPRQSPTDTRHPVDDPAVTIVHVTAFNQLMWDCGPNPTAVIEHGVSVPSTVNYSGVLNKGVVVVNDLDRRGRRLGADIFERVRAEVPIDLIGMGAERMSGLGEIPHAQLLDTVARYRFFFNPIRYTSLGLAVCEAMMIGMPIVALATTEMTTVIDDGVSGYASTDVDRLIAAMHQLLADRDCARRLGAAAQQTARTRFSIDRFAAEWDRLLQTVASGALPMASAVTPLGAPTPSSSLVRGTTSPRTGCIS